jgi:PHD/YefM family antitoxin component YafN of YafNO toxin-antitoxin module
MPITDDVRKYRETVLEQGKVALEEVRKPWYAAVGASEFAYERLQTQLTQLPAEVQARMRKLQSGGRQLDPTTVRSAVENAAEQAAGAYGTYAAQARDTYESLAHRGELVVRRLRRSDEVKETFEKVGDAVADAGKAVSKTEDAVTRPGRQTTTRKPAAKTAPARKTPAKRAPKA